MSLPARRPEPTMPAHLADELADILAEALLADLKMFPKLSTGETSNTNRPRGP